jgi:excisionase family DNA binding protein
MADPRKHPRSSTDVSADQLTLADWERDQAGDARRAIEPTPSEPAPAQTSTATRSQSQAPRDVLGTRQLLTVPEVGRVTGLSANAVYRAIWNGELRASKLRGRLRVQSAEVDAWVDAGRVSTRRARQERPAPARTSRALAVPGHGLRELLGATGGAPHG